MRRCGKIPDHSSHLLAIQQFCHLRRTHVGYRFFCRIGLGDEGAIPIASFREASSALDTTWRSKMNTLRFCRHGALPLAALLALAPACALTLPPAARNSGPAVSREGVQVAVVGQLCTESSDVEDDLDSDRASIILTVQVRNTTNEPATVDRDKFILLAPENGSLSPLMLRRHRPQLIGAGQALSFDLRFEPHGLNQCFHQFRLRANSGVILGDKVVHPGPVSFVPLKRA